MLCLQVMGLCQGLGCGFGVLGIGVLRLWVWGFTCWGVRPFV